MKSLQTVNSSFFVDNRYNHFTISVIEILSSLRFQGPIKLKIMYDELRKKAKQKVQAKVAFYICAVIFTCVSFILLMLSFYIPAVAFWLRLPIPIFIMVLGILYITAFGLPGSGMLSEDWQEEEIEKEMVRIYRNKKRALPPLEEWTEEEKLELKELERLEEKWDWDDEYV